MTVTQAATLARRDILIDRILRDPSEHCDDRDIAFRLTVLRRWITRAGGADVEFTTVFGGRTVGWMLTRRGNVVAEQELAARESAPDGD